MLIRDDRPHHVRFNARSDRVTLGPDAGEYFVALIVVLFIVAHVAALITLPTSGASWGWTFWGCVWSILVLVVSPRYLRGIAGPLRTFSRYRIEPNEVVVEHLVPSRQPRIQRFSREALQIEVGVCGVMEFKPDPWQTRWRCDRHVVWMREEGGSVRAAFGVFRSERNANTYARGLAERLGARWSVQPRRTTAVVLIG